MINILANHKLNCMSFPLNKLLELDALAVEQAKTYTIKRFVVETIQASLKEPIFKGIIGPRGVGKTVILKQLRLQESQSFYLSCDTLEPDLDLFEVIKTLKEKLSIHLFFLDEVHFLQAYDQALKKIYDFLEVQVVFTSSVALAMVQSTYDLARRNRLYTLYPFSFREYLYFSQKTLLPPLKFSALLSGQYDPRYLRYAHLFKEYLQSGLYPFCLNLVDTLPLFENIIEKIITKDASSIANLTISEQFILKKLVRFVASSPVDGINVTSIAKNLGVTKYKSEQYITLLEKAFILQGVFPQGTNVLKEPKILMHPPYRLLFKSYPESIGALREDFFVESIRRINLPLNYLKTMRGQKTPDYWIQLPDTSIVIEVGGQHKGRTQFKGITTSKMLILGDQITPGPHQQPLFLVGFL